MHSNRENGGEKKDWGHKLYLLQEEKSKGEAQRGGKWGGKQKGEIAGRRKKKTNESTTEKKGSNGERGANRISSQKKKGGEGGEKKKEEVMVKGEKRAETREGEGLGFFTGGSES